MLEHERARGGADDDWAEVAGRVHDQAVTQLAPLLGVRGVRALLRRSAQLANPTYPCLLDPAIVETTAGFRRCLAEQPSDVALATAAALFGTLFDLLETFIGRRLTAQLVHASWPLLADADPEETTP